jgi:MFS family permease
MSMQPSTNPAQFVQTEAKLGLVSKAIFVFLFLATAAALSYLALSARTIGSPSVIEQLNKNSQTISRSLVLQFNRALGLGIPIEKVSGADSLFQSELSQHPEVSFVALVRNDGQVISVRSNLPHDDVKTIEALVKKVTPSATDQIEVKEGTYIGRVTTIMSPARTVPAPADTTVTTSTVAGPPASAATVVPTTSTTPATAATNAPSDSTALPVPPVAQEIKIPPAPVAALIVGYPANYIDKQVGEVVIDLALAVLICVILAAEVLRYVSRRWAMRPMTVFAGLTQAIANGNLAKRGALQGNDAVSRLSAAVDQRLEHIRASANQLVQAAQSQSASMRSKVQALVDRYQLGDKDTVSARDQDARIRLTAFLIALSEELLRPFITLYAADLSAPKGISIELLGSIPITVFMLTWAISQPLGPIISRHITATKLMAIAGVVAAVALIATAFTHQWGSLIALRAISGAAYGCMLIAAQNSMVRFTSVSGRARGLAEIATAVVAAGVVGPAIGGLVADKFGYIASFTISATCAALAALLSITAISRDSIIEQAGRVVSLGSVLQSLANWRFSTIILFSAIPAKLAATALLLVVVPLQAFELAESKAAAGRLILLYFLAFMICAGLMARWADRSNNRRAMLLMGGVLSGLACFLPGVVSGSTGLALACIGLGIAQTMVVSPQLVLVDSLFREKGDLSTGASEIALGVFRLLERIGGVIGPIAAAVISHRYGLQTATYVMGSILLIGAIICYAGLKLGNSSTETGR